MPSGTGTASNDNTAQIKVLEAKVLALRKDLVLKGHQLNDTQHEVLSLWQVVKTLQQQHYPTLEGLIHPMQHTSIPHPLLVSTPYNVTSMAVVTMEDTRQVDLAPTTMFKEVPSHAGTPSNHLPESQPLPPHAASTADAPINLPGATTAEAVLVLTTLAIIVSAPDDGVPVNIGEENGIKDMDID
ncbi:hypothetical protein V8B97DRAFT_1914469 [Scleroderma yunnanense]